MIDILLWLIVIVGYAVAIYCVIRTYVFAISLFRQVPFVPTPRKIVREALNELDLKPGDRLVDPGSGNGFAVFKASKRLKGEGEYTGIEIGKSLHLWSRMMKLFHRNRKRITFIRGDIFEHDYSKYNKVFMFLTTDFTSRLVKKLEKELPKGSRVVSVLFTFGDEFMKKRDVKVKEQKIGTKNWNIYVWDKK